MVHPMSLLLHLEYEISLKKEMVHLEVFEILIINSLPSLYVLIALKHIDWNYDLGRLLFVYVNFEREKYWFQ